MKGSKLPLYTALFMTTAGCFAEPEYERWEPVRHWHHRTTPSQVVSDYNSRRAVHVSDKHTNKHTVSMEERVKTGLSRLRHQLTRYKHSISSETGSEFVRSMVAQTVHDLMRYEVTFSEDRLSVQQYNDLFGRIRAIETMLKAEPRLTSKTWSAWGEKLTNDLDRLTMFTHGPLN